jgi:hypothetical protein
LIYWPKKNYEGKMKKITLISVFMLAMATTTNSYASGLTDPVVEKPVVSEDQATNGKRKGFLLFLLLLGLAAG